MPGHSEFTVPTQPLPGERPLPSCPNQVGDVQIDRSAPGQCAVVRQTLERVGDKWSVLVILVLGEGPLRFNELRRSVTGISQRMLTLTVRKLERDGLVQRTVHTQLPPHVTYGLTPMGSTFIDTVASIAQWAQTHHHEIEENRRAFDAAQASSDGSAAA